MPDYYNIYIKQINTHTHAQEYHHFSTMGDDGHKKKKSNGRKSSKGNSSTITTTSCNLKNNSEVKMIESDPRFASALSHPKFRKTHMTSSYNNKHNDNASYDKNSTAIELDERFSAVLTDERFAVPGSASATATGAVDKYGRKQKKKTEDKNSNAIIVNDELSAFYKIKKQANNVKDDHKSSNNSSDTDVSSSSSEEEGKDINVSVSKNDPSLDEEEKESYNYDDEPGYDDPEARIAYLNALARGDLAYSSSSDEGDEDSVSDQSSSAESHDEDDEGNEYEKGILTSGDKIAPVLEMTNDASQYLAVLNMSWEHVRAIDLFVLLVSFCPPGSVKCVSIYPSDYGLERMSRDAKLGPQGIWKKNKDLQEDKHLNTDDSSGDDSEKSSPSNSSIGSVVVDAFRENTQSNRAGGDFDAEQLRAYEALKLKYFFAVVEFNSPESADVAYKEVDGMELEHSSAALDLRSIPSNKVESVVKDRTLKDKATDVPSTYQPPDFIVNALQQTNVKCTWEDGDYEREKKLTQYGVGNTAWDDLADKDDLRVYLASDASSKEESGSESDGENENNGSVMRKLLGLGSDEERSVSSPADEKGDQSEREGESSDSNDEENQEQVVSFVPKNDLEKKIRSKLDEDKDKHLTPWEKYLQKRKEKRREKREARKNKDKAKTSDDDSLYNDNETIPDWAKEEVESGDDFFIEEPSELGNNEHNNKALSGDDSKTCPSTKEELDLLLAGDKGEFTYYIALAFIFFTYNSKIISFR